MQSTLRGRRQAFAQPGLGPLVERVITSLPGDEEAGLMRIIVYYADGTVTGLDGSLRDAGEKARSWGLTRVPTQDRTIRWAWDTDTLTTP